MCVNIEAAGLFAGRSYYIPHLHPFAISCILFVISLSRRAKLKLLLDFNQLNSTVILLFMVILRALSSSQVGKSCDITLTTFAIFDISVWIVSVSYGEMFVI